MKVAAICCTYKRPDELATVIECFLRQDYPPEMRELIVLDDADQYESQDGDGWRIVSIPSRFRTLGEKRNASAGLVSPDVDAYCVWDDDDVYLPWHMTAATDALADADVSPPDVAGTLHAVEHAAIGMLPLFTICDRWDVGGVSIAHHPDTGGPTVFVHDAYPGGTGIAPLGFEAADRHLAATRAAIADCGCRQGCPSCVQSPKCGNGNEPLDKAGAVRLLDVLLQSMPIPI